MFKALHDKLGLVLSLLNSVAEDIAAARGEIRALGAREARLASEVTHAVTTQGARTMTTINELADQVAQNTNVEASAIQVLQELQKQLEEAGTDPSKLSALSAQLKNSSDQLARAIAFNTVAGPNPHPGLAPSPTPPASPAGATGSSGGPAGATGATGATGAAGATGSANPLRTSIALPPSDQTSTSTVTQGGHAQGPSLTPGDTVSDAKTDEALGTGTSHDAPKFGQGAKPPSNYPRSR